MIPRPRILVLLTSLLLIMIISFNLRPNSFNLNNVSLSTIRQKEPSEIVLQIEPSSPSSLTSSSTTSSTQSSSSNLSNRPIHDIDAKLNFIPKDPKFEALSPGQAKRGYESMVIQLAKPLRCVAKSRWRGPFISVDGIEKRLEKAFAQRGHWMKNVTKAIEACGNGNPMMHDAEFGFIFHMLRKGDLMLEWGSGRSSCVWAQQVGELHSVEDSSTWVKGFYTGLNVLENQVIHWMPSFQAAANIRSMSSLDSYNMYMNLPFFIAPSCFGKFNNVKFDVILVDGRVRPQCAYQALLLLKRDGVLLMHDFETYIAYHRPYYRIIMRWYELLHIEDKVGVFRIKLDKTGPEHHANPGVLPPWWTKTTTLDEYNLRLGTVPFKEPFVEPAKQSVPALKVNWADVKSAPGFKWTEDAFPKE